MTKWPTSRALFLDKDLVLFMMIAIIKVRRMWDSLTFIRLGQTSQIGPHLLEIMQCRNISTFMCCHVGASLITLQWLHNGHDGVSNHWRIDCLLNRLFRSRSKKTSKFRITGFCKGNSPGPVNYPHKAAVTRKIFLFDDVIMTRPRAVMEMKLIRECFGSFLSNWLKDSDFTFVHDIYSEFIDIFCGVSMFQKHFNISLKISSPYTKNMYLIKKWWHKRFHMTWV